ncbi:rod shape-determining protein MreD [Heliobacterium chlorum]|uniref:Rod shape-determining protein MreD n=1 Tax=Heliobacterium chlorum TaxID=2698 RepID=A0ABR7SZF0_HELCL|nr:rod shape-determining protein MreD [Heliobacterium chlorum]
MRFVILALLTVINIVLQTTLLNHLSIGGVVLHLVLIQVIFVGIMNGSRFGGLFGVLAGLLLDLVAGRYIGLNGLSMAAIGAAAGLIEGRLYRDNLIVPLGSVLVGTLLFNGLAFLLATFAGLRLTAISFFMTLLIQTLYNTAAVPLLYGLFYRAADQGWLPKEEVGS